MSVMRAARQWRALRAAVHRLEPWLDVLISLWVGLAVLAVLASLAVRTALAGSNPAQAIVSITVVMPVLGVTAWALCRGTLGRIRPLRDTRPEDRR